MLVPVAHRVSLLVLGALECLCFGGWIFGWTSLVFVLKQEGYFADRCPAIGGTSGTVGWGAVSPDPTGGTVSPAPPDGSGVCAEQDAEFQLVFTVTNFCVSGIALPLGLLYDRMGTLFMRIVISVLMLVGSLLFALSSLSPILVFPAAVCASIGGVQLLVVNLQISNLFGRNKWLVMTILCGCFDSSAWVFLVVKVAHDMGSIPVQTSFYILMASTCLLTLNSFFLLPKRASIPWPLPADYRLGTQKGLGVSNDGEPMHIYTNTITGTEGVYSQEREESDRQETDEKETEMIQEGPSDLHGNRFQPTRLRNHTNAASDADPNTPSPSNHLTNPLHAPTKDFPTLRACVLSPTFFLFYIWFSILQLDVLFFLSTLNPVLTRLANNDEQIVSEYTNALAFIQLGGILCAPLTGLLLSRNKRRHHCKNEDKERERLRQRGPYSDMKDSALVYAVSTTICIMFCMCGILPVLEIQYATFVLSVLSRSFVYSLTASGTSLFFPMEYFGTLYGLMIVLSSTFSLLQYPLFIVTQSLLNNNDFWVKISLLSASVVTYSLPIYISCYARRKEKSLQQEQVSVTRLADDVLRG